MEDVVTTKLIVSNMDCPNEVALIEKTLGKVAAIEKVSCDILSRKVEIRHSNSLPAKKIAQLLVSAGLSVAENSPNQISKSQEILLPNVVLSGCLLVTGYLLDWLFDFKSLSVFLFLGSSVAGGWFILPKAKASALRFSPDMNLLMTIAVLGAFLIGEFSEGATVTFLFALSEYLESFSVARARNAIRALMNLTPETAHVFSSDGSLKEVPVAAVVPGTIMVVRSGDRVSLDGEVVSGSSYVNQAPITGESMPVAKSSGDTVFAGSINGEGSLEVSVTKAHSDTTLSRIIHLIEEAQSEKAPTQRFIEKFARIYTPSVMVLALLVALLPPLIGDASFSTWFYRALVLLVIACPCALVIATPVAIVSGLTALARRGVLIKGGSYLEEVGKLKALAVDKTGTITQGMPEVTEVVVLGEVEESDVLRIAASIDVHSSHPIAQAIIRFAEKQEVVFSPASNYQSETGRGARAEIESCHYFVGNHRFVHDLEVCSEGVETALATLEDEGKSVVVVGHIPHGKCTGEVLGILGVSDPIRPAATAAIKALHRVGVSQIVMLSGDNQETVDVIASKAGIDEAHGDLLPQEKLESLETLIHRYHHVGMVGDGVNDAPALALASVGIAMGMVGTDAAIETADIALMRDDLTQLATAIETGQRTSSIVKANIALAIGVKVIFLLLAVLGWTSLWLAILADTGTTLLVIANALRLLKIEGKAISN